MCLKTAIDGVEAAPSLRGSHLDVYGRCMEENLLVNLFSLKEALRTMQKQTDVPQRLALASCKTEFEKVQQGFSL